MAKALSMSLTGRQIDGIWHTSVAVFDKEYCFGQGIEVFPPNTDPHGTPIETITMGYTHIPKDVFDEYIANMRGIWTADKYHLLDNNCNSFSDEVCQFLVGKHIPAHITGLPAEFLDTPFGKSIFSMIQGMYGPSKFESTSASGSQSQSTGQAVQPTSMSSSTNHIVSHVRPCTSQQELDSLLSAHRCVAIDFTSKNCGPCRMISPEFDRLITEINETYQPLGAMNIPSAPVLGLSVELGFAQNLAAAYGVTATPTFIFFLDGKKFHEFRGADVQKLKSAIDLLVYTAYPPHHHAKLDLSKLSQLLTMDPIRFALSSDLDAIIKRLKSFADANTLAWDDKAAQALVEWMKLTSDRPTLMGVEGWQHFLSQLLINLPLSQMFPALDIVRQLVSFDYAAAGYFLVSDPSHALATVMSNVVKGGDDVAIPTRVMLLRLGCNLFRTSDPSMPLAAFSRPGGNDTATDTRALFTSIAIDNLLSSNSQLCQTATMLMYNIVWSISHLRKIKLDSSRTGANPGVMADEGWVCEIVAALCSAIQSKAESCQESAVKEEDELVLR
ncbi:hypothetical protein BDEG_24268 [Batrachochytrium dendrobatidis JEL423]|uniref:PPPDE domain-containing protein n=2 Tax=Batrachochytrium dendrobatidis TaxID=109871 RepID=A0A177WK86_BATDL|nr:hypothetical protein BDEG_24268 [Batrachochytrium dendrobatidis JEL423]